MIAHSRKQQGQYRKLIKDDNPDSSDHLVSSTIPSVPSFTVPSVPLVSSTIPSSIIPSTISSISTSSTSSTVSKPDN